MESHKRPIFRPRGRETWLQYYFNLPVMISILSSKMLKSRPEEIKTPRTLLLTHFQCCMGGVTFSAIKPFSAVCANETF